MGKAIAFSPIFIFLATLGTLCKGSFYLSRYVAENNDCYFNPKIKLIPSRGYVAMNEPLDLAKVSESDRLAFYGALFAIAFADNSIDKEEVELIFGMMDLGGMTESAKRQVQSFIIEPPSLWACLRSLEAADEQLRYGLMINLVDTAWANDELDSDEEEAIVLAQYELKISNEQLDAIKTFIQKVREIRVRGLDDNYAADTMKTAAAGLSAVGVPIAAVWFSGSVIGLSAAGITSGLAGLGALIGIGGMIPGIGVAILLGTGLFVGVNALLDTATVRTILNRQRWNAGFSIITEANTNGGMRVSASASKNVRSIDTGDKSKKAQLQVEKERKAQLVIKNMQGAINQLVEQISSLQEKAINLEASASDAEANREAIRLLTGRLKFMQQSVTKRKQTAGVV